METEGSFGSLLRWAADHGISDSVDQQTSHSCLGHSLCVCFFPDAGGYALISPFLVTPLFSFFRRL